MADKPAHPRITVEVFKQFVTLTRRHVNMNDMQTVYAHALHDGYMELAGVVLDTLNVRDETRPYLELLTRYNFYNKKYGKKI